ncbi:MAG: phosphatidate cytidylyltransferase [Paenibacillus sp. RIFOXYA1_FULL_44_5]|nr:MAG: phosphatidate cytidylyltransferase [Paenibacillus sp. RIFOXYA1_FULL_44_5]
MRQRVVTGVIAAVGFLALLFLGGSWFAALIFLLSAIGFYEYARMNHISMKQIPFWIGVIGTGILVVPPKVSGHLPAFMSWEGGLWTILFLFLTYTVYSKNKINIDQVSVLFTGMLYIGVGFHYMVVTRNIHDGLFWSLFIFACIWATDSGAFLIGVKFGKHRLWPQISPKKSIEGSIGGLLFSIAAALSFYAAQPELISLTRALLMGLAIGVSGQVGDLIQSAYKRVRNIKDTGTILPGHGGVLDRMDSWLIVFPLVHYLFLTF